jgi:plastocyanin
MTGEIRFRVPLVVLPIVVLLVIALVTFGFSRVLLALEAEVATVVALVSAANLLGACAFIALRPQTARRRWAELAAVVVYPVLIGIAVAQTGYGHVAEEAGATEGTEQASAGGQAAAGDNTIVTEDLTFDTEELEVAAGEEVSYTLENNDGVVHNFAVYEDQDASGDALYTSPDAAANSSVEFTFTAPEDPGDYSFICDYHPTTMVGTLVVAEAGGGGDRGNGQRGSGGGRSGTDKGSGGGD